MKYVLIYEDNKKEIKSETVNGTFTKRIKEIESSGGWFLRVMREETYKSIQLARKRNASWNR